MMKKPHSPFSKLGHAHCVLGKVAGLAARHNVIERISARRIDSINPVVVHGILQRSASLTRATSAVVAISASDGHNIGATESPFEFPSSRRNANPMVDLFPRGSVVLHAKSMKPTTATLR